MQLIVLGMHRSGTSVLARLLNLMGAYFGPEGLSTGANQENPKGFWERKDVRHLNDSVLHAAGCDWNRVLSLNIAALPKVAVDDFNKRAAQLVLELDGHRPWLLKEPRLCLLLPLWRRFLEVPVGIHIYRHPVEVASSLYKRNRIPLLAGLGLWERYARSALEASTDMPRIVVSHRQLMEAPAAAVSRLLQDLEREGVSSLRMPTAREIEAFVRQDLYRERESRQDLRAFAKAPQLSLFRTLEAGRLPTVRHKPGDMTALAEYEAALPPLQPPSNEDKVTETTEGTLRGQLALREQEIKFVRELSSKYEADLKQRDVWLQRMEESQRQVQHDFQQARERISSLEPGIRARDERIKVLEAAHAQDRDQIGKHEVGIRARDERIKVLEAAHAQDREAVARLTADLKQVAAFEKEAAGLRQALEQAKQQHAQDQEEAVQCAERLSVRERELEQARTRAFELEAEVQRRDERIHAIGYQVEAARKATAGLELDVQKRDEQVAAFKKEAAQLEQQLVQAQQAEHERVTALATVEATLAKQKQDAAVLTRQVEAMHGELDGLRIQLKAKDTAMRELRDMLRSREHENALVAAAKLKVERTLETRYQEIAKLSQLVLARDQELARAATDLDATARQLENQRRVCAQIENELSAIKRSRSWRVLNRVQAVSGRLGLSRKPMVLLSHDATLVRQSDAFDAEWYLKQYPDVAVSGIDPVEHYLCFGAAELRDPGPDFDAAGYLQRNPDVLDSGLNPLLHYITHGKSEGRSPK